MRGIFKPKRVMPRDLGGERILTRLDNSHHSKVSLNLLVHRTNEFNLARYCWEYFGARWATVC